MDSGSITALAAQYLPYLTTFTGGFDLTSASGLELGFDERRKAERMSYRFKTEHYEMVLKAGDMERCLPALVWHLEDPRVGQSYPNYYVARLASKFVKVVLSGAGGDELFAGYPWRYYRAVVNDDFDHYVEKYYAFWQRLAAERRAQRVLPAGRLEAGRGRADDRHLPRRDARPAGTGVARGVRQPLALPRGEDVPPRAAGRRGQAEHGARPRDARAVPRQRPRRLRAAAAGTPEAARPRARRAAERERARRRRPTATSTRRETASCILRKVLSSYVSDDVADQIKQGFSGPDASWFRGESIDYVNEVIGDDDALIYEFLEPRTVRRLVDDHIAGRDNRRLLLWSLLNFEHWCRTFLQDGRPAEPAGALAASARTPAG